MAILRPEFWVKILDKHGFSSMFGLIFLMMFGYGAHWAGDNIFIPMRDSQIRLMERLGDTTEQQARALDEAKALLSEINVEQKRTAEGVTTLRQSLDRASMALERMHRPE